MDGAINIIFSQHTMCFQAKVAALVFLTALFVGFTERYLATLRPELHRMINDFETDKEALSWFGK